ncbi:MAG: hypothetical protein CL793_06455 [Chloroflexi bacterium]|nr:hypothetical protein [Chloroflexota bacterium]
MIGKRIKSLAWELFKRRVVLACGLFLGFGVDGMGIVRKSVSFGIEFAILPLVNAFCLWVQGLAPPLP